MFFRFFFFFNDTATTEIYTLSLHDALPISRQFNLMFKTFMGPVEEDAAVTYLRPETAQGDRKSTRLNSSHLVISYAVFCLKKKKKKRTGDRVLPTAYRQSPFRESDPMDCMQ